MLRDRSSIACDIDNKYCLNIEENQQFSFYIGSLSFLLAAISSTKTWLIKVALSKSKALNLFLVNLMVFPIILYSIGSKLHYTQMLRKLGNSKIWRIMRLHACPSLYLMQTSSGFFP